MFDNVREQVDEIFHDEPEHRIIDVCLTDEFGTEADLFIMFTQFFCGGLSLRPCRDLDADLESVSAKLRQCGVRCEISRSRDDHFTAFASLNFMMGETEAPVRFPIVRDGPMDPTISYFPTDSPGAYMSQACTYFHIDRSTDDDESRYFVPIVMSDGSVYTGRAPHCAIPLVSCPTQPYAVSSASSYPVIVCRCGEGLHSSFVCVYSGEEVRRVRFVPEINVGITSGTRRCHGPQLAW
jgi:hypothetical protein